MPSKEKYYAEFIANILDLKHTIFPTLICTYQRGNMYALTQYRVSTDDHIHYGLTLLCVFEARLLCQDRQLTEEKETEGATETV